MRHPSCLAGPVAVLLTFALAAAMSFPARAAAAPDILDPELTSGFSPLVYEPIGPSNTGAYLLLSEHRRLRIADAASGRELLRITTRGTTAAGFDPSDRRLFVLDEDATGYHFRMLRIGEGTPLADMHFRDRPEVTTDMSATGTVLALRGDDRTQVLLLDGRGRVTFRGTYSIYAQVSQSLFEPVAAIFDQGNRTHLQVVQVLRGRTQLSHTSTGGQVIGGFDPNGRLFALSVAGTGSTQVRVVRGFDGRSILNRTLSGRAVVGFTPDGRVIIIRDARGRLARYDAGSGRPLHP